MHQNVNKQECLGGSIAQRLAYLHSDQAAWVWITAKEFFSYNMLTVAELSDSSELLWVREDNTEGFVIDQRHPVMASGKPWRKKCPNGFFSDLFFPFKAVCSKNKKILWQSKKRISLRRTCNEAVDSEKKYLEVKRRNPEGTILGQNCPHKYRGWKRRKRFIWSFFFLRKQLDGGLTMLASLW